MCFAPEADAIVGGIVVVVGIDALRHVSEPRQIPLAALPLLFGLHQLIESFVWWGLQGHVAHAIERVAVWTYLLFAFSVVPVLVPVAVGAVERSRVHLRVIAAFAALGAFVAIALTVPMLRGPIDAMIEGGHVTYEVDALRRGGSLTAVYVVATCGALLASSSRDIAILGAVNFAAVPVLAWLTLNGFVSLWCFWAALMSIILDRHLRRTQHRESRADP
jgi:hypothetical protein